MSKYLIDKFVGKYRVKAELDQDTMDFVRDENGNIDPDFDDYYIPCRSKMIIKHGVGNILWLYCPASGTFYNVIRAYYKLVYGKEQKNYEKCADMLIKDGYAESIEFLDGEGNMEFSIKHMDLVAQIVNPSSYGANIHPHSKKNLPKAPYDIPKKDMDRYKKAKEGIEPLKLSRINSEFGAKAFGKKYNQKLRASHLKAIQFFHKEGKWDKYIEHLEKVKR